MQLAGEDRRGRHRHAAQHGSQLVGSLGHDLAVTAQVLGGLLQRLQDHAADDVPHRVHAELERGDDAEVAAAAAQRPEQVGVVCLAGGEHVAVGGDERGGEQVVGRQAVLAREPADPAAERQTRHARGGDHAARDAEGEGLRGEVDVGPQGAALDHRRPCRRIDADGAHAGEVDDDAVVAGRMAGDVVAAAADGDLKPLVAGEANRRGDVGHALDASDHGRAAVDRAVPDAAGGLVAGIAGGDDLAGERSAQLGDVDRPGCVQECHGGDRTRAALHALSAC
jgi:hypothetical protein